MKFSRQILVLAAFHLSVHSTAADPSKTAVTGKNVISLGAEFEDIQSMSHAVAIILLFSESTQHFDSDFGVDHF